VLNAVVDVEEHSLETAKTAVRCRCWTPSVSCLFAQPSRQ